MHYIAQYPVLRIAQSTFTLPWQTCSIKHHLNFSREGRSYTYPPLSIARYSFIQLSELEQCRVNKLAQGFNTTVQDSNPGSLYKSRVRSHCALQESESDITVCDRLGVKKVWIETNRCVHWSKETIWIQKIAQAMYRDEGGYRLSDMWESAPHAIWRPVKILFLIKTTVGGRNVNVSKTLVVK